MHSTWLTPPSLTEPRRKKYLGPKDSWVIQDYWEVWKEETITLAIVLQWCAIWAGPLQTHFAEQSKSSLEESDWANMEEKIWAGVMNDPVVAALSRSPKPRWIPSQTPGVEKSVASISLSVSEPEGMTPPQDLALVPRRKPPPPPGFSLQVPEDLVLPVLDDAYLPEAPTLFDLSILEALEMSISHTPVMGKTHYCLQSQSLARITLPDSSTHRLPGTLSKGQRRLSKY